jgi:hypothetical protein
MSTPRTPSTRHNGAAPRCPTHAFQGEIVLAVCRDQPDDPNGFFWTTYLVNRIAGAIKSVHLWSGSFGAIDGEFAQTSIAEREFFDIAPGGCTRIEVDDEGVFDWTVFFDAEVTHASGTTRLLYRIPKFLPAAGCIESIAELGRDGVLVRGHAPGAAAPRRPPPSGRTR